jgi:hypothetical protein
MSLSSKTQLIDKLTLCQAVLFAILFAIWILPETILIRHLCLIMGALIGLYQLFLFRHSLTNQKALPVWLMFILFIWISLHLIFLSHNFEAQYFEFLGIWKRCLLGAIFALGFGFGVANISPKFNRALWIIVYLGLLLPTLIYLLKFVLLYYGEQKGIFLPEYIHLFQTGTSRFYIAKTAYVGFCVPVLAVALGQLYCQIKNAQWTSWANLIYLMTIPAVMFIFYMENIKNGIVYALVLICIFIGLVLFKSFKAFPIKTGSMLVVFVVVLGVFVKSHVANNRSWQTIFADAQIAVQTDAYPNWRCTAVLGLPKNSFGEEVSVTNYERISWGLKATRLIMEYPLGFGLVERSFGAIGREKWPNSCLSQSHSGWLDLTLGIGIPGLLLILGALLINLKNLYQLRKNSDVVLQRWVPMLSWILFSLLLIWCTTEISQKIFLDELIYFVALASGLNIGNLKDSSTTG